MGTWRGLRVAFILGSLLMILLIIIYWDDVGGFNFYPLQDSKHELPWMTAGPPQFVSTSRTSPSSTLSTVAVSTTRIPKEAAHTEEKQEQIEEEPMEEDEEKEWRRMSFVNNEQETRKQRVLDVCSGIDSVEFPGRTRAFEQIPNRELDHLIVDDTHQIIYCYVPKVNLLCVCVSVLVKSVHCM